MKLANLANVRFGSKADLFPLIAYSWVECPLSGVKRTFKLPRANIQFNVCFVPIADVGLPLKTQLSTQFQKFRFFEHRVIEKIVSEFANSFGFDGTILF